MNIYVVNKSDNSVATIDLTSQEVINIFIAGFDIGDIAVDSINHLMYVANNTNGTITIVDTITYRVNGTIRIDGNVGSIVIG